MDEQEQTIDLRNLLMVLKDHIIVILAAMIACGVIGFTLSAFIIEKQYTSSALLYVENSANKTDDSAININDINAAQKLVNTCQILFTSDYMLKQLEAELPQYGYTSGDYKDMITIESVNSTEVLKISVVTNSPDESTSIADKLVELSQEEYMRVIKNGSIEVVSDAIYPESHTFPSNTMFTFAGLVIGLFGSYFIFLIIELLDTKVKPDDDLAKKYDIPVFAEIMDFLAVDRSNYNYKYSGGYGTKSKDKNKADDDAEADDNDVDDDDYDIDEEEEF
ncbi:MAG: hypothetical protein IJ416_06520 [Ruminiclostridium sp.]|nr:hypothetical protein [Ruminiclostridium sp.]